MKKKLTAPGHKVAKKKNESRLPSDHLLAKSKGSMMISTLHGSISTNKIGFEIPLGYNFNRNIFDAILKNKNCEGIRIYFGLNKENTLCLIITGLDNKLNDLYLPLKPSKSGAQKSGTADEGEPVGEDEEGVGDMGQACPLYPEGTVQLP